MLKMFATAAVCSLLAIEGLCDVIPQFSSQQRLTGNSFGIANTNATYDYIIIGGGLAGSVVASRLTEHSNATVAVVEAGSFSELTNGNWSQIPYWSEQWAGSDKDDYSDLVDWGLQTQEQINGEVMLYSQGKALGGSSIRNQMLYHRGTEGFYQAWADQVDDQSYTWENMTQYLERSMTFTPPIMTAQNGNVSIMYDAGAFLEGANMSNPLHVSYPSYVQPLGTYGPAAFSSIGLSQQAGFSSGMLHGFDTWTSTIDPTTGLRSSAESAFLTPAWSREALTVYINTMAQNIMLDSDKTAIGVNVTSTANPRYAKYYQLTARKEVILAAGAYHSPQILMLSGIGPNATLGEHGIEVISALEGVGQDTWDTTNIGGPVYPINMDFITSQSYENNATLMEQAQEQLLATGTGALTNIGSDFVAWYKIAPQNSSSFSNATQQHLATLPSDWPELEMSLTSSSRSLAVADDATKVASLSTLMIGTASRGNMTIESNSIFDKPIIDPNWLRDPRDQEVALFAYRLARQAIAGLNATHPGLIIGEEMSPGKNVTSDEDLLAAIKKNIAAIHHASAACKMGREGDPMAVVDASGFVFGVRGLRVVDSSSHPFTVPGHTQGTTYGQAEKMAQEILEDV